MRVFVGVVALVLAFGATLPAGDVHAQGDQQGRGAEKWRCTWKSSGIRTTEDPYHEEAHGLGRLRRCEPRERRKVFDVWLLVRKAVAGEPDPFLDRTSHTVAVRKNGRLRFLPRLGGGTLREAEFGAGVGLCWEEGKEVVPPSEKPLYTVLFVKRRGSKSTLKVVSSPWEKEPCSAPQL